MEELERRIRGRQSESDDVIQLRLEKASKEMELQTEYKYVVCNDDVEEAAKKVPEIIKENMEA